MIDREKGEEQEFRKKEEQKKKMKQKEKRKKKKYKKTCLFQSKLRCTSIKNMIIKLKQIKNKGILLFIKKSESLFIIIPPIFTTCRSSTAF